MDVGIIIAIIGSAVANIAVAITLMIWVRTEANADRRDLTAKWEADRKDLAAKSDADRRDLAAKSDADRRDFNKEAQELRVKTALLEERYIKALEKKLHLIP